VPDKTSSAINGSTAAAPHIGRMNADLSGKETAALTKELDDITRNDRYPFSERIRTLRRRSSPSSDPSRCAI